ncbi:TIGR04282 family arsenosugar biosynthesis glycosyltransferase [Psychroserpens damuponensis]|uniref:TIGR04282 family arsenosugar biosynthesis glycosyltransferase n=1 Tax=Psychroserpens damuponensis TaxID=943936 RepID=UPI0005903FC5|nr:TIGR04282 family arsenosugar biosynthesis glycosyltransferase [Psychroserpens damuponensis]
MKTALIIFTRNPELGKCKTRLAKTIGDQAALDIYKYLLQHTANVAKKVNADRFVFYSEALIIDDIWGAAHFRKKLQKGKNLGERMHNAFDDLFHLGYEKVIILGSDLLDLNKDIIENAIDRLHKNDVVIGPAEDGGYYLLGMKELHPAIFINKAWGTETVREDTIADLKNKDVSLLQPLNDIDTFDDMKHYNQLKQFYDTHD